MTRITRRELIRDSATASAVVIGASTLSTSASAESAEPNRPEHITASDPDDELRRYQPAFVAPFSAIDKMIGTFGWKAESDNHELVAYYYWTRYTHQTSLSETVSPFRSPDAHFRDHEPTIVFVDPETDDVEIVVTTGYHHYVMELEADEARLQSRHDDAHESHVTLKVVDTHHHHRSADEDRDGVLAENLRDWGSWLDVRTAWFDRGFYDASHVQAVEDPFVMLDRPHWWKDGSRDAWVGRVGARWGLWGGSERDELRRET